MGSGPPPASNCWFSGWQAWWGSPLPALVLAVLRRAPPPPDADSPALARVGEGMSESGSMMSPGTGFRRGSIGERADEAEATLVSSTRPRDGEEPCCSSRPALPVVLRRKPHSLARVVHLASRV